MAELRTLYCTPRMIIGANGTTTEFAEEWGNPAAEELFKFISAHAGYFEAADGEIISY